MLVFGQRDIPQHIGLVIDFTVRAQGAATIAVHSDSEVLTTPLHALATGLATGVMDVPAQGFVGTHDELREPRLTLPWCHKAPKV